MKKAVLIFIAVSSLLIMAIVETDKRGREAVKTGTEQATIIPEYTVILDAGHGGEDGGAVGEDGTTEKDLNLSISNGIAAFFELFGVNYIPVRTVDRSVCDDGLLTIRERKRSDILNRYALINQTPGSILLSIPPNYLTQPQYFGTQIFYAENASGSKDLAECIRTAVLGALQPENGRICKPSDDHIYLLYRAKTTSVMVECGFLSNKNELERLKTTEYQSQLGYFIFKGMLRYLNDRR